MIRQVDLVILKGGTRIENVDVEISRDQKTVKVFSSESILEFSMADIQAMYIS
jgi:hypothetical protein